MAVYAYTRVSTTRMADEGLSLDVQDRTVAGYAMMHGIPINHTYVEAGISGSVPLALRPEGKALLDALQPGDVVITPKLDRMFRSARDALEVLDMFKAKGISLHMIDLGGDVTGNGISKLVFTILSAVAEAERDRIIERIATVKSDQKLRGAYLGGKIPYGYRVVLDPDDPKRKHKLLEAIPEEQEIIAAIRARHGQPLRKIKSELGLTLSPTTIASILND